MSKEENQRHIKGIWIRTLVRAFQPRWPRPWQLGLWGGLVALFAVGYVGFGSPGGARIPSAFLSGAYSPVFSGGLFVVTLGGALLLAKYRQDSFRRNYLRALQSPQPGMVVEVVARSMKGAKALTDLDAFTAQSKAIGHVLYGDGVGANRELADVSWKSKAPLIQAVGLSAEGLVELLCRGDFERGLELNRRARAMATLSASVPGAAQSEKYHGTCVALGEVLLNRESVASLKLLEESAAQGRYPALQLLASFGLAIAMERSGNDERARVLRAFLQRTAPHCRPLQLKADELRAAKRGESTDGPVSASLSSTTRAVGGAAQPSATKRAVLRSAGKRIGLWALLIAMFVVLWTFFTPGK